MHSRAAAVCALLCAVTVRSAIAQTQPRTELGVQLVTAASAEFDSTDTGFSVTAGWRPTGNLGPEAEVAFYLKDFPNAPAFTSRRIEALFGVSGGPLVRSVRPFAKARVGFVDFSEAPEPVPCITIFPPPLQCVLAAGKTVLALDLGGGIEIYPPGRTFVRVDMSDRALRYPGTVLDLNGQVHDDPFFSHDFRFAIGGGVRF
jgi:hypothetical protein